MKHVLHPGHQRPLRVSFRYQLKLKFTTANWKYKGLEIRLTFAITENGISVWRVQWVIFKTWTWLFMTFLDGTFLTFWRISRYFLHCIVFTVFFLVFDVFNFLDLLNCVFIISDSIIVLRFFQFIKVLKYISRSNSLTQILDKNLGENSLTICFLNIFNVFILILVKNCYCGRIQHWFYL